MSNNRNRMAETTQDLTAYVDKMIEHAKKHGIQILYVHAGSIMAGQACAYLTPAGQMHANETLEGFRNATKQIIKNELEDD